MSVPEHPKWRRDGFVISADPAATDLDLVIGFLRGTYWVRDLTVDELKLSFERAAVYNLLEEASSRQVGFARVLTDGVRFAWLSDVFVLEGFRGRGLGRWLVRTAMEDPRHAEARRWLLATQDAHALYRSCGWQDAPPGRYMIFTREDKG
ncbi:MAG: GNAT family N-acetyltransferase [Geminicoccaceae bacterium]